MSQVYRVGVFERIPSIIKKRSIRARRVVQYSYSLLFLFAHFPDGLSLSLALVLLLGSNFPPNHSTPAVFPFIFPSHTHLYCITIWISLRISPPPSLSICTGH